MSLADAVLVDDGDGLSDEVLVVELELLIDAVDVVLDVIADVTL